MAQTVLAFVARLAIGVAGLYAELLLVLLAARVRRLHLHLEGGILECRNTSLWAMGKRGVVIDIGLQPLCIALELSW